MLLERRADPAVHIVEDDGRGFEPDGLEADGDGRGIGLVGMRERAALVGGTVEIESTPGEGATVFVRVPIRLEPADGHASENGSDE
jgi:signal transduction histidine kinase